MIIEYQIKKTYKNNPAISCMIKKKEEGNNYILCLCNEDLSRDLEETKLR